MQREELGDSDRYRCDRCGPAQPASKRLQIWSHPPNTLVLTLKRFASTGAAASPHASFSSGRFSAARKVATPVLLDADEALDLRPYCNPRGLKEARARGCAAPEYRLVAVANHSGTMGGGERGGLGWVGGRGRLVDAMMT
jgi:ubiquitin C-terminal hydrolase